MPFESTLLRLPILRAADKGLRALLKIERPGRVGKDYGGYGTREDGTAPQIRLLAFEAHAYLVTPSAIPPSLALLQPGVLATVTSRRTKGFGIDPASVGRLPGASIREARLVLGPKISIKRGYRSTRHAEDCFLNN